MTLLGIIGRNLARDCAVVASGLSFFAVTDRLLNDKYHSPKAPKEESKSTESNSSEFSMSRPSR